MSLKRINKGEICHHLNIFFLGVHMRLAGFHFLLTNENSKLLSNASGTHLTPSSQIFFSTIFHSHQNLSILARTLQQIAQLVQLGMTCSTGKPLLWDPMNLLMLVVFSS